LPVLQLVTHSGTFHCDDAFAYATIRLALQGADHRLIRTRDPAQIALADIVWDVGAVHDASTGRFDHHQRGAPVRNDTGIPFSAAGLVWQIHGVPAVRALLAQTDAARAEAVATVIDNEVIRRIDAIDNGVEHPEDTLGLSAMVEDCNLPWNSALIGDPTAEDEAFVQAAGMAEVFLRHRVSKVCAKLAAESIVLTAYNGSPDPKVLELDRKMPWQDPVFLHALPVIYAIYPVPGGNWMVDAMPPEPGSYEQRLPLPASWAGLHGDALVSESGIPDAVFVHPRRFVGAAQSRRGAFAMATSSIEST
jgi:uncharacterized UPF0160 family protein